MRRPRWTTCTSGLLSLSLALSTARAQSGASAVPDSVTPSPDSVPMEGKKKGGLFGKVKGVAGNKVVQSVAKTAACTMVPGGQVIAGAIDAASSKDAGDAAAGAAGAAAGQTCMPGGMGGMGAGNAGAGSTMPGLAGGAAAVGAAGTAGLAGSLVGGMSAASIGAPAVGVSPGSMGYDATEGMPSPDAMAQCMGLSAEEYQAFTDPTHGESRQPTKEEMKQQRRLAGKIDMAHYQSCVMQQSMAQMAPAGQPMAPSRMATPEAAPEAAPADGKLSEAPGKTVQLSDDLAAELAKGKTVVRDIDWLAGGKDVAPEGAASFSGAMAKLASAMRVSGASYRADIYLDRNYEDGAVVALGSARLETVRAALEAAGLGAAGVTGGKARKDKNPRLEIVKTKN